MNFVALARCRGLAAVPRLGFATVLAAALAAAGAVSGCTPPTPEQDVPCAGLHTGLEGGAVPATLSETGLFADIRARTLAPGVREFRPAYPLWSDGAQKRRFVQLPDSCSIDTRDMDHWVLPVGARLWKDFVVGGKLIETRLIARYGAGAKDFIFAAYAWREDESDADFAEYGVVNARGTEHNVPAVQTCKSCHGYLPERALGFSALQLQHDAAGVTLQALADEGRLTTAVPALKVPGDAVTASALGYLHANCGNCHNPDGIAFNTPFTLRLSVNDASVTDTGVWKTAVRVPVEKLVAPGVASRVEPGNPTASGIFHRMSVRGTTEQMPPIATKLTDPDGLSAIEAWIESLH